MKYLQTFKNLFSKSTEDWCKKLELNYYTIDDNGLVNVDDSVDIQFRRLSKIPVRFGLISANFNCRNNKLKSLEGSPKGVGHSFYCDNNYLINLNFSPTRIVRSFVCSYNQLESLKGSPKEVGNSFYCNNNKLTSLIGGPVEVYGRYDCTANKIRSLEGYPEKLGGDFNCRENPICEIYYLFPDHESYLASLDFKYLRDGNKIIKRRLIKALAEIGRYQVPDIIPGYEYI
jgi:hypothetical protein